MTQEEKQLLFKDLCSRLPYGVKGLALNVSTTQIYADLIDKKKREAAEVIKIKED